MRNISNRNRYIYGIIIVVAVVCFAIIFFTPKAEAAEKLQNSNSSKTKKGEGNDTNYDDTNHIDKQLHKKLDSIKERLYYLKQNLDDSADITHISAAVSAIANSGKEISELHEKILASFEQSRKKINDAGLPALIANRIDDAISHFERANNDLSDLLENVVSHYGIFMNAKTTENRTTALRQLAAAVEQASGLLYRLAPAPRHDSINTPGDIKIEKPASIKSISKSTSGQSTPKPQSEISLKNPKPNVLSNAAGILSLVYDLIVPDLYAATAALPEDLAETTDIQFTSSITRVAASFGGNAADIYEYVLNEFSYEPYYGALKGAMNTYRERAGNDTDLASLLIALYRAAGIPARYVKGTIEIPVEKAMKWLGVDSPEMVPMILASNGIPVRSVNDGSKLGAVEIEHVWVKALIPFANGRGAVPGAGDTWVFLDPSFKLTITTRNFKIDALPAFNPVDYLSRIRQESTVTYFESVINTFLDTYKPGYNVHAIYWDQVVDRGYAGLIEGVLPYKLVQVISEFAAIPDSFHHKIFIELSTSQLSMFQYENASAVIGRQRLTLSWMPATPADKAVIAQYGGNLYATPAYMVTVVPELRLDGVIIASGPAAGLGSDVKLTMKFTSPDGKVEYLDNSLYAGGYHAIVFNMQDITADMDYEKLSEMSSLVKQAKLGLLPANDDLVGGLLYNIGMVYFQKLDYGYYQIKKIFGMVDIKRGISTAIVSLEVQPLYIFGIPSRLLVKGLSIDVDREIHSAFPINGNLSKRKPFIVMGGYLSSFMEHEVFTKLVKTDTVSAVKVLQKANSLGIPVFQVDAANMSTYMAQSSLSVDLKEIIKNAVNAGLVVTVPVSNITIAGWTGAAYVAANPATGEADYIISSGLNGGGTSEDLALISTVNAKIASVKVALLVVSEPLIQLLASIENGVIMFPGIDNKVGLGEDDVVIPAVSENELAKEAFIPANAGAYCVKGRSYSLYPYIEKKFKVVENGKEILLHEESFPAFNLSKFLLYNSLSVHLTKRITLQTMLGNIKFQSPPHSTYARLSPILLMTLEIIFSTIDLDPEFQQEGYGSGYHITSGFRNNQLNCSLPAGIKNSDHMLGLASDILFGSLLKQEIAGVLSDHIMKRVGGVGWKKYIPTPLLHVDLNGKPSKWNKYRRW